MKKLYTVEELAEYLRVNKFTIYNWIRRKQLKSVRIGGSVRIDETDLNEFMESSKK